MSDTPLPEDDVIQAAHPTRSGRHDLYAEAMRLVGARHTKAGLVELVTWLLLRIEYACQSSNPSDKPLRCSDCKTPFTHEELRGLDNCPVCSSPCNPCEIVPLKGTGSGVHSGETVSASSGTVVDQSAQYGRPVFAAHSDGYCRGYYSTREAAETAAGKK